MKRHKTRAGCIEFHMVLWLAWGAEIRTLCYFVYESTEKHFSEIIIMSVRYQLHCT